MSDAGTTTHEHVDIHPSTPYAGNRSTERRTLLIHLVCRLLCASKISWRHNNAKLQWQIRRVTLSAAAWRLFLKVWQRELEWRWRGCFSQSAALVQCNLYLPLHQKGRSQMGAFCMSTQATHRHSPWDYSQEESCWSNTSSWGSHPTTICHPPIPNPHESPIPPPAPPVKLPISKPTGFFSFLFW